MKINMIGGKRFFKRYNWSFLRELFLRNNRYYGQIAEAEAGDGGRFEPVLNGSVPHGRGQAPFTSDQDMDVLGE